MKHREEPPPDGVRRTLDARTLRALAHPLRMNLLEILTLDGPATATRLSERVGQNTGTTSWHLRLLAKHGFIEEDPERGTKRERWWRAVASHEAVRAEDVRGNREPFWAYTRQRVYQVCRRLSEALEEEPWDEDWLAAASMSDWTGIRMTPAELSALNEELHAVVERHRRAADTHSAPDAARVIVQIQSFPRRNRSDP